MKTIFRRRPGLCAAFMALAMGCGSDDGPSDGKDTNTPAPTAPGVVSAAIGLPSSNQVCGVRILDLVLDTPARVGLTLTDATTGTQRVLNFDAFETEQSLPIIGLRFDTTYTLDLTLTDADGEVGAASVDGFSTTGPPTPWPQIDVLTSRPEQMEPGYTLFAMNAYNQNNGSYLAIMDPEGEVVWCYELNGGFALDAHINQAGHVLALLGGDITELDLQGNVLDRWNENGAGGATRVNVDSFHHEAYEMPDGNLLSLTRDLRYKPDYPASYDVVGPTFATDVMSHSVVEFTREGMITVEHALWDVLDRNRIAYDGLEVANPGGGMDWVHSNAAVYLPGDDSYVISLRHQDALIKISRATGALVWILGPHENWAPEFSAYLLAPSAGTEWSFHPHGPMVSDDGNRFLLFDNGNYRVSPYSGEALPDVTEQYSRMVEYEVDEASWTVTQTWEFLGPDTDVLFSYATGDADYLPITGNRLGTYGFTEVENGLENFQLGRGKGSSRMIEVDPTTNEVVFDVLIWSDFSVLQDGWHGYRGTRVPTLYPGTSIEE